MINCKLKYELQVVNFIIIWSYTYRVVTVVRHWWSSQRLRNPPVKKTKSLVFLALNCLTIPSYFFSDRSWLGLPVANKRGQLHTTLPPWTSATFAYAQIANIRLCHFRLQSYQHEKWPVRGFKAHPRVPIGQHKVHGSRRPMEKAPAC